jgi:cytochrome c biogenesis protein CcdA
VFGRFYIKNVDCLCPYFWGTILALIALPIVLIGKGIDKIPHVNFPHVNDERRRQLGSIGAYVFIGLLSFFVSAIITLMLIKYGLITVLFWVGVIGGVFGSLIGLVFLGAFLKQEYDDWRNEHPKQDRPNLLLEFIKAKKNKHCPLVNWV